MRLSPEEIADLAHAELTLGADPDGWRRFWRRCIALSGSEAGTDPRAGAMGTAVVGDDGDGSEGCDCWQCSPLGESALNATLARMLGPGNPERPVTVGLILELSAGAFGYTVDELRGNDLRRPLVMARHIAMYAARHLTNLSYPAIGREFGRDHSSVIHAVEKISRLMGERPQVFEQTTQLLHRVQDAVS